MGRISKTDTRLQRTAYGWAALVMALPFIAVGAFITLVGIGAVALPGKVNAPLWVIGAIGVAFALAGLTLAGHALRGLLARWRAARVGRRHPDRPWLADYPWDPAGIRDNPDERWLNLALGLPLLAA